MSHVNTGIRKILEVPKIYTLFQNILGADTALEKVVHHLALGDGMSMLDIGCGPANILSFIKNDITYTGFDFEPAYIEQARIKYPNKTRFYCENVNKFKFESDEKFDRVFISANDSRREIQPSKHGALRIVFS